jgi:hypothetical protein
MRDHEITIPFVGGIAFIRRPPLVWDAGANPDCAPQNYDILSVVLELDDGQTAALQLDTRNRVFVAPPFASFMEEAPAQALAAALCDELVSREALRRQEHSRGDWQ